MLFKVNTDRFDPENAQYIYYNSKGQETSKDDDDVQAFYITSNEKVMYNIMTRGGYPFNHDRQYQRGISKRFICVNKELFDKFVIYLRKATPAAYAGIKSEFMLGGFDGS